MKPNHQQWLCSSVFYSCENRAVRKDIPPLIRWLYPDHILHWSGDLHYPIPSVKKLYHLLYTPTANSRLQSYSIKLEKNLLLYDHIIHIAGGYAIEEIKNNVYRSKYLGELMITYKFWYDILNDKS